MPIVSTVREALDTILLHVGELGDTHARQIALDALNLAYEDISLAFPWEDQRRTVPLVLPLVVGRTRYVLPNHVSRVFGVVRNLTRPTTIYPLDERSLAELYPRADTPTPEIGPVKHYRMAGISGVRQQPVAAGEALEVFSSDPTDVSATVHVSGEGLDGEFREVNVTLTGTGPVDLGVFRWVQAFAKAYPDSITPTASASSSAAPIGTSSLGTVTLRATTDQRVLQTLPASEGTRQHLVVQFYPSPEAPDEILVPILERARVLVQGSDALPVDWWPALFEGTLIHFRRNTGEMSLEDMPPRPALLALVTHNNLQQPRPVTRGFRV